MRINLIFLVVTLVSCLLGCSHYVQTSSGADYLDAHRQVMPEVTSKLASEPTTYPANIDSLVTRAAAREPTLKFPARIGLARVESGRLTGIPEDEAEIWKQQKTRLGSSFGEFVPVSPLIAELASDQVSSYRCYSCRKAVDKIRLAAATQHLDAVLVYEVSVRNSTDSNALSITNLSIIGGFLLPTTDVSSETQVQAMLIDVINGYPYGTAQNKASDEMLATTWGAEAKRNRFSHDVRLAAVRNISEDVVEMMKELRWKLAERNTQPPAVM